MKTPKKIHTRNPVKVRDGNWRDLLGTKSGAFIDRKKEENKKACRKREKE